MFPRELEFLLDACEANHSSQIDTDKLAGLAGFASGKSANASWLSLKKKLLDPDFVNTPKKSKGKSPANADGDDGEDAGPSVSASKKGVKTVKFASADTEAGDADTEQIPIVETPKKSRAKKATAASKTDITGEVSNDAAAPEAATPAPKRKRGPNKPKDPNAPPTKRAKKGAKAGITTTESNEHQVANAQLHADDGIAQSVEGTSMFGGDAKIKKEDAMDEGPLDAEQTGMAMLDTHTEDQVA